MKTPKIPPDERLKSKYPDSFLVKEGEEFVVYWPHKFGKARIGSSKNEEGAWQMACVTMGVN